MLGAAAHPATAYLSHQDSKDQGTTATDATHAWHARCQAHSAFYLYGCVGYVRYDKMLHHSERVYVYVCVCVFCVFSYLIS